MLPLLDATASTVASVASLLGGGETLYLKSTDEAAIGSDRDLHSGRLPHREFSRQGGGLVGLCWKWKPGVITVVETILVYEDPTI